MKETNIKVLRYGAIAILVIFSMAAQSKNKTSDKERIIGAWHLARIEAPGPDGKTAPIEQPKGMLIYTRGGHISVHLMYPKATATLSNEYVQAGYEASFGSYDLDEATHLLTHRVQASVTRDLLVGKDLPRKYQLTEDGHLIIKSARPDEHWSVTSEHY